MVQSFPAKVKKGNSGVALIWTPHDVVVLSANKHPEFDMIKLMVTTKKAKKLGF